MQIEKGSYIGIKAYPADNSYNYNILTKEQGLLAGTYNTPSVEVTTISEPYPLEVKTASGRKVTYEFVTVMYQNQPWVYLNSFSPESSKERAFDIMYRTGSFGYESNFH